MRTQIASTIVMLALLPMTAKAIPPTNGDAQHGHISRIAVVVGSRAEPLERYAANQLCEYLEKLYGIKTRPATELPVSAQVSLLVGSPRTNPHVAKALGEKGWPKVSDQGIVLKRANAQGERALVIGGGSPAATLWAVYELVERWGVRYLLHRDVLPEDAGPFQLPDEDVVLEPALRVRQWRVINDFACGPESWGMADYRPVLDQLAKLKFNRIYLSIYPWQPFLHLETKGLKRRSAWLWYDYHYPITDDMPGRHLFGNVREFWNPDLPNGGSYGELAAAGEQLVHNLMAHAHARGMECAITASLMEFPAEFKPLLKDAQPVHQLGRLTIVPGVGTDVDDPGVTELAATILRTTANTYPEADFIMLWAPEFRQWIDTYELAWKRLDAKYGVHSRLALTDAVEAASHRVGYAGGVARAVQEVKGDIVALYFYDRLLRDLEVMQTTKRPDMRFVFGHISEELFPILGQILPQGWETLNGIDYTPSRVVKRRKVLEQLPGKEIPASLIYTLHDDNIGVLPQLMTQPLHQLTEALRSNDWAGYCTRYWLVGDHDPCLAYLAQAAWDATATPEAVYRDQVTAACGRPAVDDMLTVFREVETTTLALEEHAMGLTFPVPGMIMKHWTPHDMPVELYEARRGYQRALAAARRGRVNSNARGHGYVDYWIGRLEFGIGYLDTIEAVRAAASAEAAKKTDEASQHADSALAKARSALEAYARVARDQSDRGAIATMAEYVYRPIRDKRNELKK